MTEATVTKIEEKQNITSDLTILTKKKIVKLQREEEDKPREIVLYPFSFKHFNDAINIINKYYSCYRKADEEFIRQETEILQSEITDGEKEKALGKLEREFDDVGIIIKEVMNSQQSTLGEDIANFISYCLKEQLNLDDFNWGEVLAILAGAIELNMDFFTQNMKKIPLFQEVEKKGKIPKKTKEATGDLRSQS